MLLLEAGPDLRSPMPDDVRDGRSPTNATFALRGHPADYDGWAAAGNTGWSFADVLPYFCKLETDEDLGWAPWHGSSGPLPIRRYGGTATANFTDVALAGLETLRKCGFPENPGRQ